MYLFSPPGYCRDHLVKRLSCPEETGREGVGPQGGTLIFSRIRRLGLFFWVQSSEFQYIFGFSEK